MTTVVDFPGETRLDLDPDRVLEKAREAGLKGVVVLGWYDDENGTEHEYMASSMASGPEVTWLMDRCKYRLMQEADE